MNIPDKAVEAAARAEYLSPTPGLEFAVEPDWESLAEHEKQRWRDDVRASLEAAAPFVAAQALNDAATGFDQTDPIETALDTSYPVHWLRARAGELDPQ